MSRRKRTTKPPVKTQPATKVVEKPKPTESVVIPVQPMVTITNEPAKPKTPNLARISFAGECVMCTELRKRAGKENNTYIYATKGRIRYCKCRVCGHTWSKAF